jgi:hypothetical protein
MNVHFLNCRRSYGQLLFIQANEGDKMNNWKGWLVQLCCLVLLQHILLKPLALGLNALCDLQKTGIQMGGWIAWEQHHTACYFLCQYVNHLFSTGSLQGASVLTKCL